MAVLSFIDFFSTSIQVSHLKSLPFYVIYVCFCYCDLVQLEWVTLQDLSICTYQRVAISTVVNICTKLPSEPSPFMDAVPILCNLLQYEDRQVRMMLSSSFYPDRNILLGNSNSSVICLYLQLVENVAICLTQIVDHVSQSPTMLDQLCTHGLIHHSTHLLNLNSRTTLSQPIYNVHKISSPFG